MYVNDVLISTNLTNKDGLAFFNLSTELVVGQVRVCVSENSLYAGESDDQLNIYNVKVYNDPLAADESFHFNFTVNGLFNNATVYVGAKNRFEVEVNLFSLPINDVPVTFVAANYAAKIKVNEGVWVINFSGLDLIRVYHAAPVDMNGDGTVDIMDVVYVTSRYGAREGDALYDPNSDLNGNKEIDICDVVAVTAQYGKDFPIEPTNDALLIFALEDNSFVEVPVDSQGCVFIPADAWAVTVNYTGERLWMREGFVFEFYDVELNQTVLTSNLGRALQGWTPRFSERYLLQIKLPEFFEVLAVNEPTSTEIYACLNLVTYVDVEKRPLDVTLEYSPLNASLDTEIVVAVRVYDSVLAKPSDRQLVGFALYGLNVETLEEVWIELGYFFTNSSGVATCSFVPREYYEDYGLFPWFWIVAASLETLETAYAEDYVLLDTRYPTRLEFLGGEVISARVNQVLELGCRLVRADNGEPVVGRPVHLYINETYYGAGYTDAEGYMWFEVTIYEQSIYFFRLQFYWPDAWDILYQNSNNVTFTIIAQVQPVFIELTVEPVEFEPGTTLTFRAKILNASSNGPLEGFEVFFYWLADDGSSGLIGTDVTDAEGVAIIHWTYPDDGKAYVFYAYVSEAQKLATNPVQLTVGKPTTLTLNVEQGENYEFTIYGKLESEGVGVAGKQIVIRVNGTAVAVAETGQDGSYAVTLTLKPENNQPTLYQVEAIFYGDEALNFTLIDTLPDETETPIFITLQYFGYKPSTNTAWLTVEPQATQTMVTTKTPEQLQQEAENSGWLRIEHEFSWWYPWYRCHLILEADLPQGHLYIDYGWTPLPFASTLEMNEVAAYIFNDLTTNIAKELIISYFIGKLAQHAAALALGKTLVGTLAAIAIYSAISIGMTWKLYEESSNNPFAWLVGFITSAISGTFGAFKDGLDKLADFLTAAARRLLGEISHIMNSFWARGLNFFDITGIAFSLIDFAFMILYLIQFLNVI
ncbi:MAG: hypothetical protein DRJ03_23830 [Chloroflexi bacterium]|nr:MAG: hypothetical protein DRJ03_23830 [Chloroflexota bacterium]